MLTRTQEQFLELLRSGLWGRPADPTLFDKDKTDWKQIYIISKQQTVQGLVADAMGTLPKELHPDTPIEKSFIMEKLKIAQMHTLLNHVLNVVVNELNKHEISHFLLKGQGVAQNYINPTSRVCGDIDIYVGMERYKEACNIIAAIPDSIRGEKSDHDTAFIISGVTLELHYKTLILDIPVANNIFQKWTIEELDRHFKNKDNSNVWNNNGTDIYIPSTNYNLVFLLGHITKHLMHEGIGFRQICDLAVFMNKNRNSIQDITNILSTLKLDKAWGIISGICIEYLGYPQTTISHHSIVNQRVILKVLAIIFSNGNFGRHDSANLKAHGSNYITHKWKRFTYHLSYNSKMFEIFPIEIFFYSFYWISHSTSIFIKGLINHKS